MKLTLYDDDRHSLGTLSGVESIDLTEPRRREILMDELVSLLNRSELAPHTDACTGATRPLPDLRLIMSPTPPPSWWQRFIWRAR